jgi:hypothetical protein
MDGGDLEVLLKQNFFIVVGRGDGGERRDMNDTVGWMVVA